LLTIPGVRRGRYSIAIRTQAILEAKARETTVAVESVAKKQRMDNTFVEEIGADDILPLDVFDGLLDISGMYIHFFSEILLVFVSK